MVSVESFRKLALSFPGAVECPHFEKASFRVNKKIFATLDEEHNRACIMLSEIDQSVFITYNLSVIYPVPNKWGLKGATYLDLKSIPRGILKDALTHAYNKVIVNKS